MKWFLFERTCSEQSQLLPVLSPTDPVIIPLQLSHHRSLSQNVSQNALIWKGPTRILKSHFSVNACGDHSHHLGVVSPRPWPAALSCWDCALQSLAALTDRHSLNSAPSQASKHQQRHFSALELWVCPSQLKLIWSHWLHHLGRLQECRSTGRSHLWRHLTRAEWWLLSNKYRWWLIIEDREAFLMQNVLIKIECITHCNLDIWALYPGFSQSHPLFLNVQPVLDPFAAWDHYQCN